MTNPIPKWILLRYAALWKNLKTNDFTFDDATTVLNNDTMVSIALSNLRYAGWLSVSLDLKDARRRIYTLKEPGQIIVEMKSKAEDEADASV